MRKIAAWFKIDPGDRLMTDQFTTTGDYGLFEFLFAHMLKQLFGFIAWGLSPARHPPRRRAPGKNVSPRSGARPKRAR